MIQKDLNLFSAYKSGGSKSGSGGKSSKGILILAACFLLVVLLSYGGLLFVKINMQNQINSINKELQIPSVVETNSKIANEIKMNELLINYKNALNVAKKNFDTTQIIDSVLLNKITSSKPADVVINSISISPISIEITCFCTDKLAPAKFTQALNSKNIFSSVTYSGITYDSLNNLYSFNLTCEFKEVIAK